MKVTQNWVPGFTRRIFCWRIAAATSTSMLGFVAADPKSLPEKSLADDYVIVNGWVLTSKDALWQE